MIILTTWEKGRKVKYFEGYRFSETPGVWESMPHFCQLTSPRHCFKVFRTKREKRVFPKAIYNLGPRKIHFKNLINVIQNI
jgi:hypothetical protein